MSLRIQPRPLHITFLGTGTSIGIPVPGCSCPVCRSTDRRNHRYRCSILLQSEKQNILIDTAPELRLQALKARLDRLDAVFWTHGHADHLHGLDDLRSLTWKKGIPGYGSERTIERIRRQFDYLWRPTEGGGKAKISLNNVHVDDIVNVGDLKMVAIPIKHGTMPIYGWRCGSAAYLTDVSEIPVKSYRLLENLDVLIIGALRFKKHPTHFTVNQALGEIQKIRPKRAYLTHICHEVSHRELLRVMPPNVKPAWDGLRIKADLN